MSLWQSCERIRSPPQVFVATDAEVLSRLVALKVVATTDPRRLPTDLLLSVRTTLLDERWGDAVTDWMRATGEVLGAYPDEDVWSDESLGIDVALFEIRMARIFHENQP